MEPGHGIIVNQQVAEHLACCDGLLLHLVVLIMQLY